MKTNIGSVLGLYPMPMTLVGAMVDGKPNWLEAAHTGILGFDRIMVSLMKAHYTNKGIRETGKVSVSLIGEDMLDEADVAGSFSGNDTDKSQAVAWKSGETGAPVPEKAVLTMECEVVDNYETEKFDNFILKIVATWVDDSNLTDGKPDYMKMKPVIFEPTGYSYVRMGDRICGCTSIAKKG